MRDHIRTGNVYGREGELDRLRVVVDGVAGGQGAATMVTGTAGIGKTALLRAVTELADDIPDDASADSAPPPVVSHLTAVEAERGWPYSGLHLILSGLSGALSDTGPVFESEARDFIDTLDEPVGAYQAAMGLLSLMRSVRGPVLLMIDDAHLLDAGSQEALGFVARRLRSLPIGLILAVDVREQSSIPLLGGLPTLHIGGLNRDAGLDMMLSAYEDMAESVAGALYDRAGGNPRALLDVAGRLRPEQRTGHTTLDRFLPPSPVLRELMCPELDGMDDELRLALLVAAVSADGRLAPVLSALAHTPQGTTDRLVQEYLRISGGRFHLREPALASIVWHASGMQERVRAHQLLAKAYEDRDADQVLWHRALAEMEYDDTLAMDLQRRSAELVARGEHKQSVAFAREAFRLTSEPDRRRERLLMSATIALRTGHTDEAVMIARERVHLELPERQSTQLALVEARARVLGEHQVPIELIEGQGDVLAHADPDGAARFWLVAAAGFADRVEPMEARRYLALVEQRADALSEETRGVYRRTAAWVAAISGELDRAREMIEVDSRMADVLTDPERCVRHALVLARLERFAEARGLLRAITEESRFGGAPAVAGYAHAVATATEIRAGRLPAARESARAWRRVLGATRTRRGDVPALMIRAYALMDEVEAAERSHAEAVAIAHRFGDWWTTALVQSESGAMYLHLNRPDEALATLERAQSYALAYEDPSLLAAEPNFIEACVRVGEIERARSALATFEARAMRVPTAWSRHVLARCRALVAEGDESLALFAVAVDIENVPASLVELAYTQLCYGERLRRLGRRSEGTEWLQRAGLLARECGAFGLAKRAESEGGPRIRNGNGAEEPRGYDGFEALTETERRIADLVAVGRRNREVATELYLSVRTVEGHLVKIYRKLGVRSRSELVGLATLPPTDRAS